MNRKTKFAITLLVMALSPFFATSEALATKRDRPEVEAVFVLDTTGTVCRAS